MGDRIIFDLRRKAPEAEEPLKADLIIEIDLHPEGYMATYNYWVDGRFIPYNYFDHLTREQMVAKHVQVIRDVKPKTVVIRTGKNSTGHPRDIAIHPGVVKSIVEGKLTAAELTLHS